MGFGCVSENPYAAPNSQLSPAARATRRYVIFASRALGALLAVFALPGVLFSVHALIDPREAQLANDSDPFGPPPTVSESSLHLGVWLILLGIGLWLCFRRRRSSGFVNQVVGRHDEVM